MATRRPTPPRPAQPTRLASPDATFPTSPDPNEVPSPTEGLTKKPPRKRASASSSPGTAKPRKTATSTAKAATVRSEVSEDVRRGMIAEAAYHRAEKRGFSPDGQVDDWTAAEKEVDDFLKAGHDTPPQ